MPETAYVFPGQGVQAVSMGAGFSEAYEEAREIFSVFDAEREQEAYSELCFYGPIETLQKAENVQMCLSATMLAMAACVRREIREGKLPEAAMTAGFSLGEYAAVWFAGVLSSVDLARIIRKRSAAMLRSLGEVRGAMAAIIGLKAEKVEGLCEKAPAYVVVSNYNSPLQVTVSGTKEGVEALAGLAKKEGGLAVPLPVPVPSHCSLMKDAAKEMEAVLQETEFHDACMPVYMNADGKPETRGEKIRENLLKQLYSPVRWTDCVLNMAAGGAAEIIEVGPGTTLTSLVKRTKKDLAVYNIREVGDLLKYSCNGSGGFW